MAIAEKRDNYIVMYQGANNVAHISQNFLAHVVSIITEVLVTTFVLWKAVMVIGHFC